MPYTFNTPKDQQAMLQSIGAASVEELFSSIPSELRLRRPLQLPPALSELELQGLMQDFATRNRGPNVRACFLGGGSYDHFIPAAVDALASRGEFYTSYTPYQPEVSQGNLQAMFEYQTLICQLTGMDVANASLYDGGSATVEAVLMCLASAPTNRNKVAVLQSVHPEFRQVMATYLVNQDRQVLTIPTATGCADAAAVGRELDDSTACLVIQHPNFFGCLEPVEELVKAARSRGIFVVQVFDPLSLGVLRNPGELGVDIAVAEGQSLGSAMAYGGPYLGILVSRDSFLRRMPGRIAGETVSANDRRCWVLTLQTREQHIRREKATSNICTNQTLFALRASIYLSLLGPHGLREVGELCVRKAHFAADQISRFDRFELPFDVPFFKEFVVRDRAGQVESMLHEAEAEGYLAGVPLGRWSDEWKDCFLVAVTEKRTRSEIEGWAKCLAQLNAGAHTVHA